MFDFLVQILQLRLTLVKLVQICAFKANPRVSFVNFHGKLILNALDSHVLSDRAQLVVDVLVVSFLSAPLLSHHFQSFLQNVLRPNFFRHRVGGEPEVALLDFCAETLYRLSLVAGASLSLLTFTYNGALQGFQLFVEFLPPLLSRRRVFGLEFVFYWRLKRNFLLLFRQREVDCDGGVQQQLVELRSLRSYKS